jgi:hypothetical protein
MAAIEPAKASPQTFFLKAKMPPTIANALKSKPNPPKTTQNAIKKLSICVEVIVPE